MGAKISSCLNCPKSPKKSEVKNQTNNQNEPLSGNYNEQIQKNSVAKGQNNTTNKNDSKIFNGNLEEKQKLNLNKGLFEEEKVEPNAKEFDNTLQNNNQNIDYERIKEEKLKQELEKKRIEEERKRVEEEKQKEEKKNLSLQLKQKGNDFFTAKEYEKAIQQYTLAIQLFESSIYFSNRATCYKLLRNFLNAKQDAEKAIFLDENNMKALNTLGISLVELGKFESTSDLIKKGIESFELMENKATDPTLKKKSEKNLIIAKKICFLKERSQNELLNSETKKLINQLINEDKTSELDYKKEMQSKTNEILEEFSRNFSKGLRVPEYLTCRISFNIIDKAVLTPAGFSYEKQDILNHLSSANFDPMTRSYLTVFDLIPNKNIELAKDLFLKENPWAAISDHELDLGKISFDE